MIFNRGHYMPAHGYEKIKFVSRSEHAIFCLSYRH